jgi:hypothetical protein
MPGQQKNFFVSTRASDFPRANTPVVQSASPPASDLKNKGFRNF